MLGKYCHNIFFLFLPYFKGKIPLTIQLKNPVPGKVIQTVMLIVGRIDIVNGILP